MSVASQRVLAVLPARGGSKRLPGKNLRPLGGRPLLAYSILVARASRYIDSVVVTSDSPEILDAARSWGAEAIQRPAELATDTATTITAVQHALGVLEDAGDHFAWVALLQPNVPFRWVEVCDDAIRQCVDKGADGALTVDTMYLKLGRPKESWYHPDYPPGQRKQDISPSYRENGVFYVIAAPLARDGRLFGDRVLPLHFPAEQALCNIDVEFDFKLAEAIFEPFGYAKRFAEHERALI